MRPKEYESYAEEKLDQRIGFLLCVIVNIIIWLTVEFLRRQIDSLDLTPRATQLKLTITWLPWVVNLLILAYTLIFRRSVGTGYLVSFAGWTVVGVGLGLIGTVAFFASVPLLAVTGAIGFGVFLVLLAVGGLWFLWRMFRLLRRWWAV